MRALVPREDPDAVLEEVNRRFVVVRAESSPYAHMMSKRLPSPVQPDPRWGSYPEITLCGRKVVPHPARKTDKGCNACATAAGLR